MYRKKYWLVYSFSFQFGIMFEKWFHINIFSCSKKVLVSMMFSSKNSIKFAWKKSETLLELVLTILEYHHNKKDKKTSIIDAWQGRKYASDADETLLVIRQQIGWISKRVFQENKAREIFRKTIIYYSLICTTDNLWEESVRTFRNIHL